MTDTARQLRLMTIGVYGSDAESFFGALQKARGRHANHSGANDAHNLLALRHALSPALPINASLVRRSTSNKSVVLPHT